MHIAVLDFDHYKNPLLSGGQARATYEVGMRLAKRGHRVTVYCSRYPQWKDSIETGIKYRHISPDTGRIRWNNALYILSIPMIVPTIRADIIVECFTAPVSTLGSPLFTRIPVVALPSCYDAKRFVKRYGLPFDRYEAFMSRYYRYFMPYTTDDEMKMRRSNPRIESKIIPEGVSDDYFAIAHSKPKHILCLGRYDIDQKGLDILIRAYAQIRSPKRYPLVIAGRGPDEWKLTNLVKDAGCSDTIEIRGPAYGKEKAALLSEAAFVAMPSRQEGFSLFALEALASGNPVLAFDIPGMEFTSDPAVRRIPAFDESLYRQAIMEWMDPNETEQLRVNARNIASGFTWDAVTDQWETFFESILKRKTAYETE